MIYLGTDVGGKKDRKERSSLGKKDQALNLIVDPSFLGFFLLSLRKEKSGAFGYLSIIDFGHLLSALDRTNNTI